MWRELPFCGTVRIDVFKARKDDIGCVTDKSRLQMRRYVVIDYTEKKAKDVAFLCEGGTIASANPELNICIMRPQMGLRLRVFRLRGLR